MSTWLLAFVTSTLGIAPLLIRRRFAQAIPFWVIGFFLLEAIYYAAFPSMVWPFLGIAGFLVAVLWTISAIVDWVMEERPTYIRLVTSIGRGHLHCDWSEQLQRIPLQRLCSPYRAGGKARMDAGRAAQGSEARPAGTVGTGLLSGHQAAWRGAGRHRQPVPRNQGADDVAVD